MIARRRSGLLLLTGMLVAALAPAAVGAGNDYSYLTRGTYQGTAVVQGSDVVTPAFAGGRYPVSFRLTSPSRRGIRFIRGLTIGPVAAVCNRPSGVVGKPADYAVRTLPRLASFPAVTTNGFIIRSFVLRGTHWKPVPGRLGMDLSYTGPLPHIDLGFVFNRNPTRFNPNPVSSPSVSVTWTTDDAGNLAAGGAWHCSVQSVVTVRLKR